MSDTRYIQFTHRELPYSPFDADNHLYETTDALTKFLPREYEGVIKYVGVAGRTNTFHEPDPKGLIDLGIPFDHLMSGSDFPHPEGMADPLAYSDVVKDLPLEQQALIMGGSLEKAMKVGRYAA